MSEREGTAGTRGNRLIAAVVCLLAAVVCVTAYLNRGDAAEKRRMQQDAVFLIRAGETTVEVTMDDVQSLDPQEIEANYKKSGKEPERRSYTGVPLIAVLDLAGLLPELEGAPYTSAVFTAADGYASALPLDEALDGDLCFIVIAEEGQPLGTKEEGGSGPFRMILPHDQFSQRWCSFLLEVSFQP